MGAVAAPEIQAVGARAHLEMLEQQAGALVDLARREEAPGGAENEGAAHELGLEDDVFPIFIKLLFGQHDSTLAVNGSYGMIPGVVPRRLPAPEPHLVTPRYGTFRMGAFSQKLVHPGTLAAILSP